VGGPGCYLEALQSPLKATPASKNFNFRAKITKLANGKAKRQQQKKELK